MRNALTNISSLSLNLLMGANASSELKQNLRKCEKPSTRPHLIPYANDFIDLKLFNVKRVVVSHKGKEETTNTNTNNDYYNYDSYCNYSYDNIDNNNCNCNFVIIPFMYFLNLFKKNNHINKKVYDNKSYGFVAKHTYKLFASNHRVDVAYRKESCGNKLHVLATKAAQSVLSAFRRIDSTITYLCAKNALKTNYRIISNVCVW